MPDANGKNRLDHIEEVLEGLLEHARLADKRLDAHEAAIQILRDVSLETNQRISALVSTTGDYVRVHEKSSDG